MMGRFLVCLVISLYLRVAFMDPGFYKAKQSSVLDDIEGMKRDQNRVKHL